LGDPIFDDLRDHLKYLHGILRPDLEGLAADEFLTPGSTDVPVTVARPSQTLTGFLAPPR
jgi:hypothetical protein